MMRTEGNLAGGSPGGSVVSDIIDEEDDDDDDDGDIDIMANNDVSGGSGDYMAGLHYQEEYSMDDAVMTSQ
jgi:hypothetical protein